MTKRRHSAGDELFRKDDRANEMFFVLSGRFRLKELGMEIAPGQVVGELGLLSPDQHRGQTLECVTDGEVLSITYDQVRQLYFQNPEFGFFFLQLTARRLFQNIARLETELTAMRRGGGSIGHEGAARLGEAEAPHAERSDAKPERPGRNRTTNTRFFGPRRNGENQRFRSASRACAAPK
jgi:CRP-like cAMP-binding protein